MNRKACMFVPDHFRVISEDLWAVPIKTVVLALYAGLLALEARPRAHLREAAPADRAAAPLPAGSA